ncbi:MAG: TRAP transporter large permease [Desulfobacterota bacterium]|nr:TRAP transporter large permease [Thermodesulfobacteriota bacterium]MDW8002348.1 TRAP transporter large permease [Deltaproteobacteria bacterium]
MEWYVSLFLILGSLIFLLIAGFPVFLAFTIVNIVGIYFLWGGLKGLIELSNTVFSSVANFVLIPVPAFILMGELIARSGVFQYVIETLDKWVGRVRGRLCYLAIGSATIFAALSGSAQGTTAMIGSILLPEMYRRGYKRYLAISSCFSGALAMIIPPSAFAVILGALAEVSIGKLLISGILPGLVLSGCYIAYVTLVTRLDPESALDYSEQVYPWKEKIASVVKYILPFGGIMFLVTWLIFFGLCTPSESAILGIFGSVVLIALYGRLSIKIIKDSLIATIRITVMMFMILTGAIAFGQILAYTGASQGLCQFVMEYAISPVVTVIIMQIVYLVLGCFMEQVSILMITLPIFMPILKMMDINTLWFCLVTLLNMGIAMKSPPFGLTLFVMQGVAPKGTTIKDIYKGAIFLIICDIIGITVVFLLPEIALFLPGLMKY